VNIEVNITFKTATKDLENMHTLLHFLVLIIKRESR